MLKSMIRQRWIPSIFILGFLVIIAVNGILIVAAVKTFSGLVVAHPYTKGIEYNENKKALIEQQRLDWKHSVSVASGRDGSILLQVQWSNSAGAALGGLSLTASLERPVEKLPGVTVVLQDRGGGVYAGSVMLPRAGLWDLHMTATQGDRRFVAADRIQVP